MRLHKCELCEKDTFCELDKSLHDDWLKQIRLGMIRKYLVVSSNKCGIGSTLFSIVLASHLSGMGYKVGLMETSLLSSSYADYLDFNGEALEIYSNGIHPPVSKYGFRYLSPYLFMDHSRSFVFWEHHASEVFVENMIINTNWGDLDILIIDIPVFQLEMLNNFQLSMPGRIQHSLLLLEQKSITSGFTKSYVDYMNNKTKIMGYSISPFIRSEQNDNNVYKMFGIDAVSLPFVERLYTRNIKHKEFVDLLIERYSKEIKEVSKLCLSIFSD